MSTKQDSTAAERKRRQRLRDALGLEAVQVWAPWQLRFRLVDAGLATAEQVSDPERYAILLAEIVCEHVGVNSHAVTEYLESPCDNDRHRK